jgi:hypothetical protein
VFGVFGELSATIKANNLIFHLRSDTEPQMSVKRAAFIARAADSV